MCRNYSSMSLAYTRLFAERSMGSPFYGRPMNYDRPLYFCPVVSSILFYVLSVFFSRLISAVADWISTILPPWWGPSANLGCRSETCCMRLAGNAGRKKSPKIRHLRTIAQLCRAISSQLRNVLTIGISSTCPAIRLTSAH